MTQQNFAQVLGLNPATLSQILSGKANPTLNHVDAIRRCFPSISYTWLLDGNGPMFQIPTQSGAASVKEQTLFTADGQPNIVTTPPTPVPAIAKKEETKPAVIHDPAPSKFEMHKVEEKPERKIKEIVIYYDNNTFETFVPK